MTERPSISQQITFLYTRNLETTADFYERIMGLPLVLDQGVCRIYRTAGDAFVGFCQRDDATQNTRDVIFTMATSKAGVEAWHTYLSAQGVVIEKPPTYSESYNIYHIFFRDPNGYKLEIQEFRDPAWPAPVSG
jgi:catechol 2,3-dioxygenase-like lactoylglutathione lyase family enzyme